MAKITAENRELFASKMQPYKDTIDTVLEKEKTFIAAMAQNEQANAYKRVELAEDMIYITTLYVLINNLSVEILTTKNTDALNEELVRKLGLALRLVVDAFGDNTKWRWAFVELQGRFTTVAKNMIPMKAALKIYFDPRSANYDTVVFYFRLIKKMLGESADGYRDRYELSTRRFDDIRLGINYLAALRRFHIMLEESAEAEEVKKKALVWKTKMEDDRKKGISN